MLLLKIQANSRPEYPLLQSFPEGGYMANLKGLESIVSQLRKQKTNFANQLRHVDAALAVLGKLDGGRSTKSRRAISASGRRRIAAAQKARWAKVNKQKVVPIAKPGKRRMSASARRKIAAAQRKRWAKLKRHKRNTRNDRATRL